MKKKLLILALHLAANGTDAYLTHRNMGGPHPYELNPMARPFVTHGTGTLVSFFSSATVMELLGTYELSKHGHPRLAAAWEAGNLGSHAWGVVTSERGYVPVTSKVPAPALSSK